jgi:hypothetical protein
MKTSIDLLRDSIAALRGAHSSPICEICLGHCAPCALLSKRRLRHVTGEASRLRERPPVAFPAPDASQHRVEATSLRFLEVS